MAENNDIKKPQLTLSGGYTYEQWLEAVKPNRRENLVEPLFAIGFFTALSAPAMLFVVPVIAVSEYMVFGRSNLLSDFHSYFMGTLGAFILGIIVILVARVLDSTRIDDLYAAYPEYRARKKDEYQRTLRMKNEEYRAKKAEAADRALQDEQQRLVELRQSHTALS